MNARIELPPAREVCPITSHRLLAEGALLVMRRFAAAQAWLPGRRSFAVLLAGAGAWWVAQGLGYAA